MKHNTIRRTIPLFLVFVLILSTVPVFGADSNEYPLEIDGVEYSFVKKAEGYISADFNATTVAALQSRAVNKAVNIKLPSDIDQLSINISEPKVAEFKKDVSWIFTTSGNKSITIPGAYIQQMQAVNNQNQGKTISITVSDKDGNFNLDIPSGNVDWGLTSPFITVKLPVPDSSKDYNVRVKTIDSTDTISRIKQEAGMITAKILYPGQISLSQRVPKTFNDVKAGWMVQPINDISSLEIMKGINATQFKPNDTITKEQFASILVRMFNLKDHAASDDVFHDWLLLSDWAVTEVGIAKQHKLVEGDTNYMFYPKSQLTRQDMCVMTLRALNLTEMLDHDKGFAKTFNDRDKIASYAKSAVDNLSSYGLIEGDDNGNFNPKKATSRAEAAKFISNILEYDNK